LKKYLTRFNHPAIFWLIAISWTLLVIIVLLKPGDGVMNHELSLSSFLASFFSLLISRRELSEAIGHVILFGVLTILWLRVLMMYFPRSRAIFLAICIAIVLALATEIGQYFVNRGSLLFDLLANILGVVIAFIGFGYVTKSKFK